jgi:hypothetical protein
MIKRVSRVSDPHASQPTYSDVAKMVAAGITTTPERAAAGRLYHCGVNAKLSVTELLS